MFRRNSMISDFFSPIASIVRYSTNFCCKQQCPSGIIFLRCITNILYVFEISHFLRQFTAAFILSYTCTFALPKAIQRERHQSFNSSRFLLYLNGGNPPTARLIYIYQQRRFKGCVVHITHTPIRVRAYLCVCVWVASAGAFQSYKPSIKQWEDERERDGRYIFTHTHTHSST